MHPLVQLFEIRFNSLLYKDNIQSPADLASHFGWLEILDHFETNQSPGDLRGPAVYMMTVATRSSRTSVVRWLIDRKVCPTDEHLNLAFHSRRSDIIQFFFGNECSIPVSPDTLVNGQEILILAVRMSLSDIYRDLIKKGANMNCRDEYGRSILFHAVWSSTDQGGILEDLLLRGIDHNER